MTLPERYRQVVQFFEETMPEAETELHFTTPFELLVAVMLSAQCTDSRVNKVTPALFRVYPDPYSMAQSTMDDILELVKSISYPNSKSKHLLATAQILVEEYDGQIPLTVEELVKLPGVGRKTANVITSVLDQQPNMAVDTHVFRVAHRLGLVAKKDTTPLAVEKKLIKYLPEERIHKAHHWLILHGRYRCKARKPECRGCGLFDLCKEPSKHEYAEKK